MSSSEQGERLQSSSFASAMKLSGSSDFIRASPQRIASAPASLTRHASSGSRISALTDFDDPIGYQREKVLRGRQIRGELAKISVVDAENLRVELEGSCQLLLFMNFIKTIQSGGIRAVSQFFQILVVERPYDQKDGSGAGFQCLQNLNGMNHEILSEGWGVSLMLEKKVIHFP